MPYADVNDIRMYYEELGRGVNAFFDAAYTEADQQRVGVPTLLDSGETDPWANLDQMLAMRRSIPAAELLSLNRAGADPMSNLIVQFTRADIVCPVVLDFLARHAAPAALG